MSRLPNWLVWRSSGLIATERVNEAVTLSVQKTDNRGMKLRKKIARRTPISAANRLWRTLQDGLRPDLCIDVGANYGEVSLSSRYHAGQRTYLVEANLHLVPALHRSVATHATPDGIEIVQCFAGEASGEAEFHIDLKWSGTSSALFKSQDSPFKGRGEQSHQTIAVNVRTIDSIVMPGSENSAPSVLLKVDVEGAELQALRGARRTLSAGPFSCLIVEYNMPVIAQTGADPSAWLAEVGLFGEVFVIEKQGLARCDLTALGGRKCDLAVIRDSTPSAAVLSRAGVLMS